LAGVALQPERLLRRSALEGVEDVVVAEWLRPFNPSSTAKAA
jgi:hypothetical protein